ncbi:MAG: DUF2953 domain-containing protein [Methanosarcinales archaeon]|nr:DUF2953 domain-containing protein [Methanosarcinales archaeon]
MLWLLVIGIILIIFLLALAILIIPIKFHTESSRSNEIINFNLAISWLIFKIKYTLKDSQIEIFFFNHRIVDLVSKGKTPKKKKTEKKKPNVSKPAVKKSRITSFIKKHRIPSRALNKSKRLVSPDNIRHITGLVKPMRKLSREMVNTIKFRHLKIDTIYGLDDPAHTGITAGFFYATLGSCKTEHEIRFTPDFTGPMLDWDMMAQITFTPINIFPPIIRFSTNRQVIRSVWGIIRC